MKKTIHHITIILLGLLALSACQGVVIKERPSVDRTFYRCFIASYLVPQSYQAQFANLNLYGGTKAPKDASQAVYLAPLNRIEYNPFFSNAKKHEEYARRYQDTTYNRMMSTPVDTEALAEPLDSIRCYAIATDGSLVDISENIKCLSRTYLPYIRSGYRDDLVPSEGVCGKLWQEYEVYKPLKELTQEDLTLVVRGRFRLEAIPPYQFDSDVLVRVFSSADEPKEVIAKYNFPKGK